MLKSNDRDQWSANDAANRLESPEWPSGLAGPTAVDLERTARRAVLRRRLRWSAGLTLGLPCLALAWGFSFDDHIVPLILIMPAMGLGIPLTILIWVDLVRSPRPVAEPPRLTDSASVVAIRCFGLLTFLVGFALAAFVILYLGGAFPYHDPKGGSPVLSLGVAGGLMGVGWMWTRRPLKSLAAAES